MKKTFERVSFIVLILLLIGTTMILPVNAAAQITVDPKQASGSGVPGSVITYELTVTNNSTESVQLSVSAVSASGWPAPVIVPASFQLDGGKSRSVIINLPIPSEAADGQNDITTIYFKNDLGATKATAQLTTRVSSPELEGRPLVVVNSYAPTTTVYAGKEFSLVVGFRNKGDLAARNIAIAFAGTEFYPTTGGGVQTIGNLSKGETKSVTQNFIIGDSLAWSGITSLTTTVTYTDDNGKEYSESYTLSIVITPPNVTNVATATPVVPLTPQLMVVGYKTDVDPLQPGSMFNLKLDVKNMGMADAKTVTVVLGGGVSPNNEAGTPSGGLSGSGGDLANFAPMGSSNLIYIGDIASGATVSVSQRLVVNVSTAPGAYTFKMSFVYDDSSGNRMVDDQVITMLVYSLPQIEVSFYRDPGVFSAGMDNTLPLQVTNLGNSTSILGNMTVTSESGMVMNNISLVGALEPGGYFTLDAMLNPAQEGSSNIKVSINYTDDFNQPRVFEQVLPIEIQPAMEIEPTLSPEEGGMTPEGGLPGEQAPETFWQKILRFFKGLFGLGSDVKTVPTDIPIDEEPVPVPGIPKG